MRIGDVVVVLSILCAYDKRIFILSGMLQYVTVMYRNDKVDILTVSDWGQKLSYYLLNSKQVCSYCPI